MKIAILPSNQHQNEYLGLPGITEEKWAVEVCKVLVPRLREYGADVKNFYTPGSGAKSTDELAKMIADAMAWKPDYWLSVHSDSVKDKAVTGVLMIVCRVSDMAEGRKLGKLIATKVGLPYKTTWDYGRKILYTKALVDNNLKGCLVEIGEHSTTAEANWNWNHRREIGIGIAEALAEHLGLEEDMAVDKVSPIAARDAFRVLEAAGILNKEHPSDDAASVGLVQVMAARLYQAMQELSKKG